MKEVKKKEPEFPIRIREKVVFQFAVQHNAERVATALAFGGLYVRCTTGSSGYLVYVYSDRNI